MSIPSLVTNNKGSYTLAPDSGPHTSAAHQKGKTGNQPVTLINVNYSAFDTLSTSQLSAQKNGTTHPVSNTSTDQTAAQLFGASPKPRGILSIGPQADNATETVVKNFQELGKSPILDILHAIVKLQHENAKLGSSPVPGALQEVIGGVVNEGRKTLQGLASPLGAATAAASLLKNPESFGLSMVPSATFKTIVPKMYITGASAMAAANFVGTSAMHLPLAAKEVIGSTFPAALSAIPGAASFTPLTMVLAPLVSALTVVSAAPKNAALHRLQELAGNSPSQGPHQCICTHCLETLATLTARNDEQVFEFGLGASVVGAPGAAFLRLFKILQAMSPGSTVAKVAAQLLASAQTEGTYNPDTGGVDLNQAGCPMAISIIRTLIGATGGGDKKEAANVLAVAKVIAGAAGLKALKAQIT